MGDVVAEDMQVAQFMLSRKVPVSSVTIKLISFLFFPISVSNIGIKM